MSVHITDPIGDSFPDGNGWMAFATIDSDDPVDGYMMDCANGDYVPSEKVQFLGTSDGIWRWSVTFAPDSTVHAGDQLSVCVYDAHNILDSDTVPAIASENGGGYRPPEVRQRRMPTKKRTGRDSATSIHIKTPITFRPFIGVHNVPVTIELTPGATGAVFLLLRKFTGEQLRVLHRHLPPSKKETRTVRFRRVDVGSWEGIHVIAVARREPPQEKPQTAHDTYSIKALKIEPTKQ